MLTVDKAHVEIGELAVRLEEVWLRNLNDAQAIRIAEDQRAEREIAKYEKWDEEDEIHEAIFNRWHNRYRAISNRYNDIREKVDQLRVVVNRTGSNPAAWFEYFDKIEELAVAIGEFETMDVSKIGASNVA